MKNFIFDLDGTLFDSYEVIVESALEILRRHGFFYEKEWFRKTILSSSLGEFFDRVANDTVTAEELDTEYKALSAEYKHLIVEMPHALETLRRLKGRLFVYTHRGATTDSVLKALNMDGLFEEVVTSLYLFPRKPSPDGLNYLIEKYALSKEDTYYVGDRRIDMECADNAGVKGVLYLPETSLVSPCGKEFKILSDLKELLLI